MKALIVGCGNIGSVAAEDLAKSLPSAQVTVADNDEKRARIVAERIGTSNVSSRRLDVTNSRDLVDGLKGFDLVLGFLPGTLGFSLMKSCIAAKVDLIDVSFTAENPLVLHKEASAAKVAIVPDCGLAPGISNVLVGHATAGLSKIQAVHIMVGGLPATPFPPLEYVITWSPESLIDEYTRKARVVKKGRIAEEEVLSGLESVEFPGLATLEAFLTDGLRTLLYTVKDAEEMWEKTLRYPGHAEKIKALRGLGFFDESPVVLDGAKVSPRKLTVKLLADKLKKPEVSDVVAMKVQVSGMKNGRPTRTAYHLLDRFAKKGGVTAMARTTAYPASIVAQLMLNGKVKDKGVIPPETLGADDELFRLFCDALKRRGIKIIEQQEVKD